MEDLVTVLNEILSSHKWLPSSTKITLLFLVFLVAISIVLLFPVLLVHCICLTCVGESKLFTWGYGEFGISVAECNT